MKKIAIRLGILLAVGLFLYSGYDAYSQYMVTKLYQYIDAGNTEKALACIEKMPDVNTLEMCMLTYCVARTFTGGASMTGYPLYYAVSHNADISIIKALLEKGADPNRIDLGYEGHYPLRYACNSLSGDMYERIRLLVEYGADINTGYLYIPHSIEEYSEETKKSIFLSIIYLWENGVEEWHYTDTEYERTVLHEAAAWMETDNFREFYHNETRPLKDLLDARDANGETALFYAIRAEMFDNYDFLIEEGADITIKNNDGKTVLDVAVELGYDFLP
mgnify:CR=1 FL=1